MPHVPIQTHLLSHAANGRAVYADLNQMPLAATISRNPHLLNLIEEVITGYTLDTPELTIEHDMGRTVGYNELVKTEPGDTIFYAQLTKSDTYTRFVKNRHPEATRFVTVSLRQLDTDGYEIVSVSIGKRFPPSPDDSAATAQSLTYWQNHAVAYNGQPLNTASLTKTAPY